MNEIEELKIRAQAEAQMVVQLNGLLQSNLIAQAGELAVLSARLTDAKAQIADLQKAQKDQAE